MLQLVSIFYYNNNCFTLNNIRIVFFITISVLFHYLHNIGINDRYTPVCFRMFYFQCLQKISR